MLNTWALAAVRLPAARRPRHLPGPQPQAGLHRRRSRARRGHAPHRRRLAVLRQAYLDGVPADVLPPDAAAALYDTLVRYLRDAIRAAVPDRPPRGRGAFLAGPSVTAVALPPGDRHADSRPPRAASRHRARPQAHHPAGRATRGRAPGVRCWWWPSRAAAAAVPHPELVLWVAAGALAAMAVVQFLAIKPRGREQRPVALGAATRPPPAVCDGRDGSGLRVARPSRQEAARWPSRSSQRTSWWCTASAPISGAVQRPARPGGPAPPVCQPPSPPWQPMSSSNAATSSVTGSNAAVHHEVADVRQGRRGGAGRRPRAGRTARAGPCPRPGRRAGAEPSAPSTTGPRPRERTTTNPIPGARQPGEQARVELLDLLQGQPAGLAGEVDQRQVAGRDDDDLRALRAGVRRRAGRPGRRRPAQHAPDAACRSRRPARRPR